MITKSKHLEAVIRKHWRELIRGKCWIDAYNNSVNKDITGTILTNLTKSNLYFINDPPNPHKPLR